MLQFVWFALGLCLIFLIIDFWLTGGDWTRLSASKRMLSSDEAHFNDTLLRILVPRWLGSSGHTDVRNFLVDELNHLGLNVIRDEFTDPIPVTNVLGIMNPNATHFLMLSCHYDSKYLASAEEYVAATDGAVSCAILLNMAKRLKYFFLREFSQRKDIGLLLVFFDGHDSVNGITDMTYPLLGSRGFVESETIPLKQIALLISLNLIGAPNHIYMSRYEQTFGLHERMSEIEFELRQLGQLSECHQLFYKLKDHDSDIDDDHNSFLDAGVPVMHVVPHTYPELWLHKDDNFEHLHWPTVRNMNVIITRFVFEYFNNYNSRV